MDHSINLVNPEDIETYLKKFCSNNSRLEDLLTLALFRVIKKMPECMETLDKLPTNSPAWLKAKWCEDVKWHQFDARKNIRLAGKVYHVVLWLERALEYDMDWLKNVDEKGRPKKLLKVSSMDQLTEIMRKDEDQILSKKRKVDRAALKDEEVGVDIVKIMEFDDGHSIVELITKRALDREGAFLEHCIGDGQYDGCLLLDNRKFYSLRDKDNFPCVSFSVDMDWMRMLYIAGKRNSFPSRHYFTYFSGFCAHFGVSMTGLFYKGELYESFADEL